MPRSGAASEAAPINWGLPIILGIIQLVTISVYFYFMTFLVASMAVQGNLGVLGPERGFPGAKMHSLSLLHSKQSYLTILISFLLLFILLINEAVFLLRQTLTSELYLNSQIVKISLFVMTLLSIAVFGLAGRKRDINHANATLTGIIGLTLLASIPFALALVLAWMLQRTRACGISIVVTAVDEEAGEAGEGRPLLGRRAYTT